MPNVSRNTITAPTTSVLGDDPNVVAALEFHKRPMGGVGHSLTDGPTWLAAPRRVKDPTWVRRALKSLACYTPFFFGLISLMTLSAFFMAVARPIAREIVPVERGRQLPCLPVLRHDEELVVERQSIGDGSRKRALPVRMLALGALFDRRSHTRQNQSC